MYGGRSPDPPVVPASAQLVLAALLWIVWSASAAAAQSVAGRVVDEDTGTPVPFAGVALIDSTDAIRASVASDSAGSFFLRAPAGMYRIRAQGFGFATAVTDEILLRADEPVIVELRLSANGIPLEPLVVRARGIERGRDGFERRSTIADGVFMNVDSVLLRHPRFAQDVFRAVDGIMMKQTGDGYQIYPMEGGRCMAVYVNHNAKPYAWYGAPGVARGRAGSGTISSRSPLDFALAGGAEPLLMIDADAILGVEVYRTFQEIPEELRTAARVVDLWPIQAKIPCGMALIWTRVAW